jgi:hypothetical protein
MDTAARIEALTTEVARLSRQINNLAETIGAMGVELAIAVGVRERLGYGRNRADGGQPSRPARASARRPGHLRAVDGGQR